MRSKYVEISCDSNLSGDCYETFGPERDMGKLIPMARKAGWKIGRADEENDVCPTCRIVLTMERRYGTARPGSKNMESS